MIDGRAYDDQRPPWIEGADYGNAPQRALATKMLWALLALFLMAGVATISYLAGRALGQEPIREAQPDAREAPTAPPPIRPPPVAPRPSVFEPPPPVARMLEAPSERPAVIALQRVEKKSATSASKERRSSRAPKFRPPRRVLIARRALTQPRRVLYASRVVQLGVYPNRRQATAALARLVRVYPYIKTLPKTIKAIRSPNGGARVHYLRLRAYSPDHARILCQSLHSIGRGCAVLPETGKYAHIIF